MLSGCYHQGCDKRSLAVLRSPGAHQLVKQWAELLGPFELSERCAEPFQVGPVPASLQEGELHQKTYEEGSDHLSAPGVVGLGEPTGQSLRARDELPLAGLHPPPDIIRVVGELMSYPGEVASVVVEHHPGGHLE